MEWNFNHGKEQKLPSFFCWMKYMPRRIGSLPLLPPDPASHTQLELLPAAAGEEDCHVPMDDQPVEAVPHFPVAVSDAPWRTLPCQLSSTPAHLQAVTKALRLALLAHEPQERHVHRRHAQQERLKVQAEVLPKTFEDLHVSKHQPVGEMQHLIDPVLIQSGSGYGTSEKRTDGAKANDKDTTTLKM